MTLAGLLGMHGLAEHGTGQVGSAHMSTMAADAGSAAAHLAVGTAATASTLLASMVSHDPGGGTGTETNGAAMCLAVLLLTAIAVIVALHAGRLRPLLFLSARPVRAPVASGRGLDPPRLFVLSIQRC